MNHLVFKQIIASVSMLKHRFISHHYMTGKLSPSSKISDSIHTFCVAASVSTFTCDHECHESRFTVIRSIIAALNFEYPDEVDEDDMHSIVRWAHSEVVEIPYFLTYAIDLELSGDAQIVEESLWMCKQLLAAAVCIDSEMTTAEVVHSNHIMSVYSKHASTVGVLVHKNLWDFPLILSQMMDFHAPDCMIEPLG